MTPRAQAVAMEWYEAGYVAGVARGREAAEDELAALQRAAVDSARRTAARGPYADLAKLRGEHDRAARQGALIAERGIA